MRIDLIFNDSGRGPAFLRQILNVTAGTDDWDAVGMRKAPGRTP
jgi:hypothetical protein